MPTGFENHYSGGNHTADSKYLPVNSAFIQQHIEMINGLTVIKEKGRPTQ